MATPQKFLEEAERKAFNLKHRRTLNFNIGQYDKKVPVGKAQFGDVERARMLGKNLKWQAIGKLDQYLLQFEEKFTARGGKVIWAEDSAQACQAVLDIAKEHHVRLAVKSKSMVTEEIHLNHALEEAKIEVLETDLGEYIVQLEDSTPYHIITPIMHKSKEDVSDLFHLKFGTPRDASPTYIARFVRGLLRQKFQEADMGITGGNFLLADTGGVVLTENEGNARLSMALPRIHVVIVGIEKMLPSIQHLETMLPLLSTFGTGQNLTVYNTIVHGPKQPGEVDGPEEMYVILLDNGRSRIIADTKQRQSMYCIRCGACLNACPVYKNIGGHTYGSVYSGPIGKVLAPNLNEKEKYAHLSNASSLCGACTAACPVKIDLHELILNNRVKEQQAGMKDRDESQVWSLWRRIMHSRMLMNVPAFAKNYVLDKFFSGQWGERREMPVVQPKSFNKLWKEGKV